MESHAVALKNLLVDAIAGRHPERPGDVAEEQYEACRRFLAHFAGNHRKGNPDLRGCIFSLNYDLLLYWTLLHDIVSVRDPNDRWSSSGERTERIAHDDGFRAPEDELDAEYVTWDAEDSHTQNLHYLHGALHLFEHGPELQKKCWQRSGGTALIEQVRSALDEGRFPLFVSEGQSRGKLERIRHSAYLARGLRTFRANCKPLKVALFIFGHSLAANDTHILRQIEKGRCKQLFVSLFGDPKGKDNKAIVARAEQIKTSRDDRYPLEVQLYDASSANVWG